MPKIAINLDMWQKLKMNIPEMSGPGKVWEKEAGVGHSKEAVEEMRRMFQANDGAKRDYEIEIAQETYDRLKSVSKPGETPNQTLRRVLKEVDHLIPDPPTIELTTREMLRRNQKKPPLPPTMIDTFYKSSFAKEAGGGWTSNAIWREAFTKARRFILDDDMSTFLGELGTIAFRKPISRKHAHRIADHLRIGARLPFPTTWVEYNLRNAMKRSHEIMEKPFDPTKSPATEGWLLEQHPSIPTAIRAHILSLDPDNPDEHGFRAWTFPVAFAWTVDEDTIIPWRGLPFTDDSESPSATATGVPGYHTDRIGIVFSDMVNTPPYPESVVNLIKEWAGCVRRMWAFLATIDDLPVQIEEVRPSKGFVARGSYRKYLHHRTITLTVPAKKHRTVARTALAIAHRRAHEVRGHWRKDWRRPLANLCEHEFTADEKHMTCGKCKGRKIWVDGHQRGTAQRGLTTHDYVVKHGDDDAHA